MNKLGLCVLIAVATAVAANDLTVGTAVGKKIHDEKLEASPTIWRQDKNFTFNATEGHVITRVIITDLRPNKDGEAKIVDGGEGHKNVTIELKSPAVFRGFEFNVQVYAAPDNNQQSVSVDQQTQQTPQVPAQDPKLPIFVIGDDSDDLQQSVSVQQQTTQQTPQVPTQKPKVPVPEVGDASGNKQQSVSVDQQTTQQTPQVPTQKPKVPVPEVGDASGNKQQSVSVDQQTTQQTPQVPTQEPKVQIPEVVDASGNNQQSVSVDQQQTTQQSPQVPTEEPKLPISVGDASDDKQQTISVQQQTSHQTQVPTQEPKEDKLRKTRKAEEQDKQNVSSQVSASEPTPVPKQVQKESDQKINIPVNIGQEVTTSTLKSVTPAQKEESDVVDPDAVHQQPTHLNNTDKVAPTDATQQVPKEGSQGPQFRDFRQSESTTEAVTPTTKDYVERTTVIDGVHYGIRIPNYVPSVILPPVKEQSSNPPQSFVVMNGPAMTHEMAPLPYNH